MKINKKIIQTALDVAKELNVDFNQVPKNQFIVGFKEELEHGSNNPEYNITNDDPIMTAKIALVHLKEDQMYYTKLLKAMGELDD